MFRMLLATATSVALTGCAGLSTGSGDLKTTEHSVPLVSTAPSMMGQPAQLYVREVKSGAARAAGGCVRPRCGDPRRGVV